MKHSHPLAQNLFERLSRFTPRQGAKRKREPLEDYFTEALAFFILVSEDFRRRFVTSVLGLESLTPPLQVATQFVDEHFDGRADLVIVTGDEPKQRVGIEVKRYANFQPRQLDRMRVGFPLLAFLLAPESFLHENRLSIEQNQVTPVSLEDLHHALLESSNNEKEPHKTLLIQFAVFLELKGHARVRITSHPMKVKSLTTASRLIAEWTDLFVNIRAALGFQRKGKGAVPIWEMPHQDNQAFCFVVYESSSCAGFEISDNNSVRCYYHEARPIGKRKKIIEKGMWKGMWPLDDKMVFWHAAPYPTPDVPDQSVKILEIFRDLQKRVRVNAAAWSKKAR